MQGAQLSYLSIYLGRCRGVEFEFVSERESWLRQIESDSAAGNGRTDQELRGRACSFIYIIGIDLRYIGLYIT